MSGFLYGIFCGVLATMASLVYLFESLYRKHLKDPIQIGVQARGQLVHLRVSKENTTINHEFTPEEAIAIGSQIAGFGVSLRDGIENE